MAYTVATHESPLTTTRNEAQSEVGGSLVEASGGAAAIILSILGLLHVSATLMASIATIVLGASFLVAGSTVAARFSKLLSKSEPHRAEMIGGGMAMESLGGAAGIVLGILSLVGAGSTTLLPVAAIVFGGSLLVANGTASRLDAVASGRESSGEVFDFATGPTVLIALSGIVLGILALADISPIILSLAAMLSLGAAVLLSGVSLASMMLKWFSA